MELVPLVVAVAFPFVGGHMEEPSVLVDLAMPQEAVPRKVKRRAEVAH